jgi:hypothetical protein
MARDPDKLAASFEIGNTGGFLSGFLAEEDVLDRSGLWRLAWWGAASLGAVILAVYANQSSMSLRRDQVAAVDLGRQTQQIQAVARESQSEARRLASAIETLNGDRDRLYSRLSALEQGLDSVTGAIAKQKPAALTPLAAATQPTPPNSVIATAEPAPAAPSPAPGPLVSPVSTTVAKAAEKPSGGDVSPEPTPAMATSVPQKNSSAPAGASAPVIASTPAAAATVAIPTPPATPASGASSTPPTSSTPAPPAAPVVASKSTTAAPEPATAKSIEPEKPTKTITATLLPEVAASVAFDDKVEPDTSEAAAPTLPVQRTEFGVDVGGANSVGGLRALWRGLLRSRSNAALTTLRPIIVVREGRNGLGMQLRLVAGPLDDAAGAAKICAGLIENERPCETAVFDGQRLAMNAEEAAMAANPAPAKPAGGRSFAHRRSAPKRVAAQDPPKPDPPPSTLSSFFRR